MPAPKNRFQRLCTKPCAMRWWHQFPEFTAKIYTPARNQKCGDARARFFKGASPEAEKQRARISGLCPSINDEVRAKISAKLKAMGHKPPVRRGNGFPPPEPQRLLAAALGAGWTMEFVVATGLGRGFARHYKLDISNRDLMIAIEADGPSHCPVARQESDARKDAFLRSAGWTVLRFSNREILAWIGSGMSTETSISTTFRQLGIHPSASRAA